MSKILTGIGAVIVILIACWGVFTYLEKYALCAEVSKMDQKMDKAIEMMDMKTNKMMEFFDYKFLAAELKSVEERIYEKEKEIAKNPTDGVKKAELDKLKRDRENLLREMDGIKQKK